MRKGISDAKEDSSLFKDERLRLIYEDLYEFANENGWVHADAGEKSLISKGLGVEYAHDPIKFIAFEDAIAGRIQAEPNMDAFAIERDKIANEISRTLFKDNIKVWLVDYIGLCAVGFIRSVVYLPVSIAQLPQGKLLIMYAFFVYLLAFFGIIYFWKNRKVAMYMILTLLSIASIVCSASLVIMCSSRYMIYNLSIFYVGFVIMFSNRKVRV